MTLSLYGPAFACDPRLRRSPAVATNRDCFSALGIGANVTIYSVVRETIPTGILPDGVDPWNPATFPAVGILLLATGAGADPSPALRQD